MKKLGMMMAAALLGAILGIACGGSKAPAEEPTPPAGDDMGGGDTYGAPAYGGDAYGAPEGETPPEGEGGGEEM